MAYSELHRKESHLNIFSRTDMPTKKNHKATDHLAKYAILVQIFQLSILPKRF